MGIVIPPKPYYLGMQQWEVTEGFNGPWDIVLYELRKFVGLLCRQNPNVLQLLWLEKVRGCDSVLPEQIDLEAVDRLVTEIVQERLFGPEREGAISN